MKKVAVLTGGGDCPGLNAVIRAIVRTAGKRYADRFQILGVRNGWDGMIKGLMSPLSQLSVSGILHKGGTILGTSRTNPYRDPEVVQALRLTCKYQEIHAIIAIGGDDTLTVAARLFAEEGINTVGVPKTIDNDLMMTDYTFGFNTAISIVADAIDRLHTTAESHHRILVVEVMGRHAGWIATYGGLAGGADWIVVPERPYDIEEICQSLRTRHQVKNFSIVVVAEGAKPVAGGEVLQSDKVDEFGNVRLGGIGVALARQIEDRTGIETRVTILGHVQRGGTPTAFDRVLATQLGVKAMDLVAEGQFGKMATMLDHKVTAVDLKEVGGKNKTLDPELYDTAEIFFG